MNNNNNEVTSCNVIDKKDNENLMICAEWNENDVKFFVIKNDNITFKGETKYSAFKEFSKKLKEFQKEPEDKFIQYNKDILCGKLPEQNIEFEFENGVLYWGTSFWVYNKVNLEPSDRNDLLRFFALLANANQSKSLKLASLKRELQNTENRCLEFGRILENFKQDKLDMEEQLYNCFIPLLNAKKDRIKKLLGELKRLKPIPEGEEAYYQSTEEFSEDSQSSAPKKQKMEENFEVESIGTDMKEKSSGKQNVDNASASFNKDSSDSNDEHTVGSASENVKVEKNSQETDAEDACDFDLVLNDEEESSIEETKRTHTPIEMYASDSEDMFSES